MDGRFIVYVWLELNHSGFAIVLDTLDPIRTFHTQFGILDLSKVLKVETYRLI